MIARYGRRVAAALALLKVFILAAPPAPALTALRTNFRAASMSAWPVAVRFEHVVVKGDLTRLVDAKVRAHERTRARRVEERRVGTTIILAG